MLTYCRHGGVREKGRQREFASEALAELADQTNREQTVATELEKTIVEAYPLDGQTIRDDLSDFALQRTAGCYEVGRGLDVRQRKRFAVELV